MLSLKLFPNVLAGATSRVRDALARGARGAPFGPRAWLLLRIALFIITLVLAWALSSKLAGQGADALD